MRVPVKDVDRWAAKRADDAGRLARDIVEYRAEIAALKAERDAAWKAGMLVAAEIAQQHSDDFLSPDYAVGQPLASFGERFACEKVRDAIRTAAERGTP